MKIDTSPLPINVNFKLQEFFIEDLKDVRRVVPPYVFESVLRHHLIPLNFARSELGCAIHISRSSGFRSVHHEQSRGRNGLSLHCFGTGKENPTIRDRMGASDITLGSLDREKWPDLIVLLSRLPYKRICLYPNNNFVHVDYNSTNKMFYTADTPASKWKAARFEQLLDLAKEMAND